MSCIRSCYDKDSPNFEHDDCSTCIHGDRPPQRTWVSLTTDEIDKAWRSVDYTKPWDVHRIDVAHAIETKLKEKNT